MLAPVEEWVDDMNGEQVARELGELNVSFNHLNDKIDSIDSLLTEHMDAEEARLKKIEEQLSFGRFILFAIKAVGMTLVLLLTLKLGDISALWKGLK